MTRREETTARCPWATTERSIRYHDEEWGVPLHDDRRLFELLVLEGAQAGLSWETILAKRERYREVFEGFDPARVVRFTSARVERLMRDPGIVRNRLKIESAIGNAKVVLKLQDEHGTLDRYLWSLVGGRPVTNNWTSREQVPSSTPVSDAMSKALKREGMRFVGTTICYAFMQATGMVNDHLVGCPRHQVAKDATLSASVRLC